MRGPGAEVSGIEEGVTAFHFVLEEDTARLENLLVVLEAVTGAFIEDAEVLQATIECLVTSSDAVLGLLDRWRIEFVPNR